MQSLCCDLTGIQRRVTRQKTELVRAVPQNPSTAVTLSISFLNVRLKEVQCCTLVEFAQFSSTFIICMKYSTAIPCRI